VVLRVEEHDRPRLALPVSLIQRWTGFCSCQTPCGSLWLIMRTRVL
jgi:hypothetical protein